MDGVYIAYDLIDVLFGVENGIASLPSFSLSSYGTCFTHTRNL